MERCIETTAMLVDHRGSVLAADLEYSNIAQHLLLRLESSALAKTQSSQRTLP
jgi:hypothetical protein